MSTVVILQPGYLPWLGFFDQMLRSDIFVYYDDVQYDKHGWRNRNRIKSPRGPHWLTVPVLHTGKGKPSILDIQIDNRTPWARKHIGSIQQFYAGAKYLDRYLPELEKLLLEPWERLVDLDIAAVSLLCKWLSLKRRVLRSSELNIPGDRSERLLAICRQLEVNSYLSGDSAKNYLDLELFLKHGIRVEWHNYNHPVYEQLHGDFIPQLSALDLILNHGEGSLSIIDTMKLTQHQ